MARKTKKIVAPKPGEKGFIGPVKPTLKATPIPGRFPGEQGFEITGGKTTPKSGINLSANVLSAVSPAKKTSSGFYQGPMIDPVTGRSTYTAPPVFQGPAINIKTGTSTLKNINRSSGGQAPGASIPFRNDLQANGGAGYTALSAGQFGGDTSFSSFSSQSSPSGGLSSNASNVPQSSVVNTNTLAANNTKLTFPEATIPDYSQLIPTPIEQQVADAGADRDTALQDLLKSMAEPPDSSKAYEKAQRETGILQKQQLVNDLTGELNGIVAKGQAQQLAQVGQGRGIPEAIIGGIQAQIGRETAIAALPIQAQLSAATGNLEMANENLDTLFKIYSEDARNEYEYKREVKKMVYDFATEKEKKALEKLDKQEERAYKETQDLNDERNAYAKMAFENGDSVLGAKIAKLNYKSPTFRADLATLSSKIVDTKRQLEIQKLQSDLANSGTTISPKVLATTQFKNAQAAQNLKITLEEAKAAVEKYGNYENLSGTGKGILDTLKIRLASQISTALEQGVVMPGEMENFQKVAGQLNSSFFGIPNVRNSKTLGSLNSLINAMNTRIALQKAALTNTYNVSDEQVDTLLNITNLSDQEFMDMDALVE